MQGQRHLPRLCPRRLLLPLRIHPPQADPKAMAGELHWLMAMRHTTDLLVPEPVPTAHRALLVTLATPSVLEPHHGVLLRWLPGRIRSPEYVSMRQLEHVGATIAALHAHAARYVPAASCTASAGMLTGWWVGPQRSPRPCWRTSGLAQVIETSSWLRQQGSGRSRRTR